MGCLVTLGKLEGRLGVEVKSGGRQAGDKPRPGVSPSSLRSMSVCNKEGSRGHNSAVALTYGVGKTVGL